MENFVKIIPGNDKKVLCFYAKKYKKILDNFCNMHKMGVFRTSTMWTEKHNILCLEKNTSVDVVDKTNTQCYNLYLYDGSVII